MIKSITTGAVALLIIVGQAVAGPLTSKDVEKMIAVGHDMQALEKKYPDFDADAGLDDPTVMSKLIGTDGSLQVLTYVVGKMPKGSAIRKDATGIVKRHGYKTLEEFAGIGDRITMAMVALEFEQEDMSALDQMTPEMAAMMPPEVQAQIAAVRKMVVAANKVSAADKAVVRPHLKALENAFDAD